MAQELLIKNELLQKWQHTMNTIFKWLMAYKKEAKNVNLYLEDNAIFITIYNGNEFKIKCFFVNSKYLQLQVTITGHEDFEANITHIDKLTDEGIVKILAAILTFTQKIDYALEINPTQNA